MRKVVISGLLTGMAIAAAIASCNPGGKADEGARASSGAPAMASAPPEEGDGGPDPRNQPVPEVNGRPIWSANRQRTAEENARAAFERNGETFGATDFDDFVAKVHAFTGRPPAGVQKISRANGDVELYDPKTNTFAVVTRDGAPRTMFKPDDGQAYWAKEKERAANGGQRSGTRSRSRKPDDREG